MAYTVPADPGLDLVGLLDSVPDLAKKAITGGAFLGDIDDITDNYDVRTAVDDLANQKFSALRPSSPFENGILGRALAELGDTGGRYYWFWHLRGNISISQVAPRCPPASPGVARHACARRK